jgi:hypothetical protein
MVWDQFFLGLVIGFFGVIAVAVLFVLFALIGWMNSGSH